MTNHYPMRKIQRRIPNATTKS